MKFDRTSAFLVASSAIALLAITLHWVRPGYVVAQTDLFPMFDPFNYLAKTFWAWNDSASPFGNFSIPSFSAYYFITGVASVIAGPSIGQGLVNWFFITLQWTGAFAAARVLGLRPLSAFVASWCYTLSAFAQFYDGTFLTAFALASSLPWILAIIAAAGRYPQHRARLRFATIVLAVTILPIVAATPQLFFELVLVSGALVFAVPVAGARRSFLLWCGTTSIFALAASLWWLVPALGAVFLNTITHATKPIEVTWTFARTSLLNDLRFVSLWTWLYPDYAPYGKAYDANLATYAAGFALAAGLALALLLCSGARRDLARRFGAIALACIFVVKGLHEPAAWINAVIYKLPGFFLLIESAGLGVAATLLLALCLGLAIDALRGRRYAASVTAALTAALLAGYPVWTGEIAHDATQSLPSMYVRLPQYWSDAADALNRLPGSEPVLLLPADPFYQASYTWGYLGVDVIAAMLVRRSVILPGAALTYFIDSRVQDLSPRIESLANTGSPLLRPFLRTLGIRYVLYRSDLLGPEANPTIPASLLGAFSHASIRRFGSLTLFDLGSVPQPVRFSPAFIAGNYGRDFSMGDFVTLGAMEEMLPRVDATDASRLPENPVAFERVGASRQATARSVWRGVDTPGSSAVAGSATVVVRASVGGNTGDALVTRAYRPSDFRRMPTGGLWLPIVTDDERIDSDHHSLVVLNPTTEPIAVTMRVRFAQGLPTRYALAINNILRVADIDGSDRRAAFVGIRLAPGPTQISLTALRKQRAIDFMPRGSDVVFNLIAPESTRPPTSGGTFDLTADSPVAILGYVPVSTSFAADPQITLVLSSRWLPYTGVAVFAESGGVDYRCTVENYRDRTIAVNDAVARCLDENGAPSGAVANARYTGLAIAAWSGEAARGAAHLDRFELSTHPTDAGSGNVLVGHELLPLPVGAPSYEIAEHSTHTPIVFARGVNSLSVLAAGLPPLTSTARDVSVWHGPGFSTARVDSAGIFVNGQLYNKYWLAWAIGAHALHLSIDGWQNGWYVDGPATIVTANVFDLAEVVGLALALAALAGTGVRCFRS